MTTLNLTQRYERELNELKDELSRLDGQKKKIEDNYFRQKEK
jgi:hypothetical protein